jgi:hypothetical protein
VVSSASSDNGVQIVGASAPSLRIDNAETGATKRAGLGISTAVNNFIQGSADRDFCIFNGSTTASPILFGVYNGTNIQEAARISTARNLLVGSVTDSGQTLQITGNATFKSGTNYNLEISTNSSTPRIDLVDNSTFTGTFKSNANIVTIGNNSNNALLFTTNGVERARITSAGVLLVGTTTTVGSVSKLQVSTSGAATETYIQVNKNGNFGLLVGYSEVVGSVGSYIRNVSADPMYFLVNNTTTALTLKSTGIVNITNTPVYATNALAIAGGLAVGDIYKSSTGVLSIVY